MLLPIFIITATLTFPIPQLGNCQSIAECKNYCDVPWHHTVCTNYAQELETEKNVLASVKLDYPIPELDNCKSKDDCKAYCDLKENYESCSQFAEEHGLPTGTRAATPNEEKLNQITFPIPELDNCASRQECKEYCDNPANRDACKTFAEEQGLMQPGRNPVQFPIAQLGNCASKEACEKYCSQPENTETCMEFAREMGLEKEQREQPKDTYENEPSQEQKIEFPIEELGNCNSIDECDAYCRAHKNEAACREYAEMTSMDEYYEEGFGEEEPEPDSGLPEITFPIAELGNCGSMEECDIYCQQPDHKEACTAYAKATSMSVPEEHQQIIEGPGGCSSKDECAAYCNNPDHRTECLEFAQKMCEENPNLEHCQNGSPKIGPGGCTSAEECKEYCKNNPNDADCQQAKESFCAENPEKCKIKEEEMKKDMEDEFKEDFTGPGGCTTPEECKEYCQNNPNDPECKEMKPKPEDMEEKEKVGPGGCTSAEECLQYCKNNPDDPGCTEEMMEKLNDY